MRQGKRCPKVHLTYPDGVNASTACEAPRQPDVEVKVSGAHPSPGSIDSADWRAKSKPKAKSKPQSKAQVSPASLGSQPGGHALLQGPPGLSPPSVKQVKGAQREWVCAPSSAQSADAWLSEWNDPACVFGPGDFPALGRGKEGRVESTISETATPTSFSSLSSFSPLSSESTTDRTDSSCAGHRVGRRESSADNEKATEKDSDGAAASKEVCTGWIPPPPGIPPPPQPAQSSIRCVKSVKSIECAFTQFQ